MRGAHACADRSSQFAHPSAGIAPANRCVPDWQLVLSILSDPVGDSWQLIGGDIWDHGGDGCALFTFFGIQPAVGNVTTFRSTDEQPFVFQSIEVRGRFGQPNNSVVMVRGFLGGREVATQVLESATESWLVVNADPAFRDPIHELRLEVVQVNGGALMLDNLVFAHIPEPGNLPMLGAGLAVMLGVGKWARSR